MAEYITAGSLLRSVKGRVRTTDKTSFGIKLGDKSTGDKSKVDVVLTHAPADPSADPGYIDAARNGVLVSVILPSGCYAKNLFADGETGEHIMRSCVEKVVGTLGELPAAAEETVAEETASEETAAEETVKELPAAEETDTKPKRNRKPRTSGADPALTSAEVNGQES